jgi:hypothetical protein
MAQSRLRNVPPEKRRVAALTGKGGIGHGIAARSKGFRQQSTCLRTNQRDIDRQNKQGVQRKIRKEIVT